MTAVPDRIVPPSADPPAPEPPPTPEETSPEKLDAASFSSLCQTLAGASAGDVLIQDFVPLDRSIEWALSKLYWARRGTQAFVASEVPYIINNDGRLSEDAAALLVKQLEASTPEGGDPSPVRVLEIGAGSGLFARLFLDALRRESDASDRDFYERTTYYLTDASEAMLENIAEAGLMDGHVDRVVMGRLSAPQLLTGLDELLEGDEPVFHLVIMNYVLDNMPGEVVRLDKGKIHRLMVQTVVDDRGRFMPSEIPDLGEIESVLRDGTDEDQERILSLYRCLLLNTRYDEVAREDISRADDLPDAASVTPDQVVLHSHGALDCIDAALGLLADGGFAVIADYGYQDDQSGLDVHEYQHFDGSIAIGLNFSQFDRVYGQREDATVVAPPTRWSSATYRMIGRTIAAPVADEFRVRFDATRIEARIARLEKARRLVSESRLEAARWKYRQALEDQPHNWVLMEEIASVLQYQLNDPAGALEMTSRALDINPRATGLWNIAGDALYELKEPAQAQQAFSNALELNPRDVRALLNSAWMFLDRQEIESALHLISHALCNDVTGEHRDTLLAKQNEALQMLADRTNEQMLRELNRFRGHRAKPE